MTNDFIEEKLDRQTDRQYENCVSLGWFCGTASSLSKLGLRSHSGPFDWYFSHFWAVISQIENNFKEFMLKENLETVDDNVKVFRDVKYGFYCSHDVENDFETEYSKIYARYMRRADYFMEMIERPTVFFRTVRDDTEVEYINNNWENIDKLLKSYNPYNTIVYVCRSGIVGLTKKVKVFDLGIEQYIGKTYEMRHMFDNCLELKEFCSSLISIDKMQKNVDFDNMMNSQKATAAYINKCVEENVDGLENSILDALNATADEGIFLWGAGKYGLALANYLRDRNVSIAGIIDNEKQGEEMNGFFIQSPDVIPTKAKIFIAIAKKEANKSIVKQIDQMGIEATVIRYEDIYEEDI